ncbi:MAG: MBL fold metallo-hydrolase [Spirochaetes bacterium]|nr:MBL fold metallo-hydrolase [Spirochaetota bacterium]MBN2770518.1 MBL fold metallo-hydrolase [Spirochaetota bacterium]
MKIEFVGAARTVTGSSYIVKNNDFTVMIDCGMFQGNRELRERNQLDLIYAPQEIDALLVTHAHIDHSGLIPKLVKEGFTGKIFATKATCDLLRIMLPDSAHIQEMDAEFVNRRNRKLGRPPVEPLYTEPDALKSLEYIHPVKYGDDFEVTKGVRAVFRDAGHILGSSFIELSVTENGKTKKIVFSGDLGPKDQAIIRNAENFTGADYLLIESTYGNRLHKSKPDTYEEFKQIIHDAYNRKGNIVIPSFAVERTQEIIYTLAQLFRSGDIPKIPTYIDSPLAISATEIFRENSECFDDDTRKILESGGSPLDFPNLHLTRTTAESKDLTKTARGSIIISASGMCTAGRIKYHLQSNLYKPDSSIVFVGYQAEGTLGRKLVDGAKVVRVYGEDVAVNAKIHTLGGFSGHADRDRLLEWMGTGDNPDMKVFVVHGEHESSENLASLIREKYSFTTIVPTWGEIVDLDTFELSKAEYGEPLVEHTDLKEHGDAAIKEIETLMQEYISKYKKVSKESPMVKSEEIKSNLDDLKQMITMLKDEIS